MSQYVMAVGIFVVILAALGLMSYVVRRNKLRRFKISAKLPLVSINVEIDTGAEPDVLPPGEVST